VDIHTAVHEVVRSGSMADIVNSAGPSTDGYYSDPWMCTHVAVHIRDSYAVHVSYDMQSGLATTSGEVHQCRASAPAA
jgi:hypothetical protein